MHDAETGGQLVETVKVQFDDRRAVAIAEALWSQFSGPQARIDNSTLVEVRGLQDVLGLRVVHRKWTEAELAAGLVRFASFIFDPKMQPVWRELSRQKGRSVQASLSFFFVAYSLSRNCRNYDQAKRLLPTDAERRKRVRQFEDARTSARAAAAYFRRKRCDEGQELAQAMERAAADFERQLTELMRPSPLPTIIRIRDDRRRVARTYATLLANVTQRRFGQVLLGAVATTTTVGLRLPDGEEISPEEVRSWCKPSRHPGDKRSA
jgi:hypothetical protein